jgi:hypothetical protein
VLLKTEKLELKLLLILIVKESDMKTYMIILSTVDFHEICGLMGENFMYQTRMLNLIAHLVNQLFTLPDALTNIEHVWETSTECVICLSADSEIIFTPCGHKCSCLSCGKKLKQCCICRAPIKSMITMEEANTMLAQL